MGWDATRTTHAYRTCTHILTYETHGTHADTTCTHTLIRHGMGWDATHTHTEFPLNEVAIIQGARAREEGPIANIKRPPETRS